LLSAAVAALVVPLAAPSASAAYTIELNQSYQGASPSGDPPWISASFSQQDSDTVRLTLTSRLEGSEYVCDWLFNLNPSIDATGLSFSLFSSTLSLNHPPEAGNNAFALDGTSGRFDIAFHFELWSYDLDARFSADDEVVYDISRAGGLLESDFAFGSEGSSFRVPPISVANVSGIGPEFATGSIRDSGASLNAVPAPPALILAILGILGLPALRPWLRTRQGAACTIQVRQEPD
jgi:hypothetical protein